MFNVRAMTLLALSVSAVAVFATTAGWLIDSTYGVVSETSEKLKDAGLIQGSRIDSKLCGPTSLMMVMAKAMKQQGIASPYSGLIDGIVDIVKRVVPETDYTVRHEVTKGVDLPNLLQAIELEFKRVGIKSVAVQGISDDLRFPHLKPGDIRKLLSKTSVSLQPNDALILNISYYKQSDADTETLRAGTYSKTLTFTLSTVTP